MKTYQLSAPNSIDGGQLVEQIKASLGIDIEGHYSFNPPSTVVVSDFDGYETQIASIVAAHTPVIVSGESAAQVGVKAWYMAHPNAALLFNLPIADLDTEIDSMADALFPPASGVSNANKNRFKLWAKTVSHAVRALSKREGFT